MNAIIGSVGRYTDFTRSFLPRNESDRERWARVKATQEEPGGMGLPPIETGRGRIDLIMDVKSGKVAPTSQPAEEFFYKAYNISYWTMPREDAVDWLNTQFGTNVE